MALGPDPKKLALLIMAKKGSKPSEPEEEKGEEKSDESSPHEAAASDVLDAIKSEDPEALAEALKAFVELCSE
jgi:hypothetical protein